MYGKSAPLRTRHGEGALDSRGGAAGDRHLTTTSRTATAPERALTAGRRIQVASTESGFAPGEDRTEITVVIGTGAIGGTLARGLAKLGHQVSIANSRGPETLREFAAEIGAKAVSVRDAARAGDVVILSIPQKAVPELAKDLFAGVPSSVVVIDTGNYYPQLRDGRPTPAALPPLPAEVGGDLEQHLPELGPETGVQLGLPVAGAPVEQPLLANIAEPPQGPHDSGRRNDREVRLLDSAHVVAGLPRYFLALLAASPHR
jgi:hypothetical protein